MIYWFFVLIGLLAIVDHLQNIIVVGASSLSIDWVLDDSSSRLPIAFFLVDYSPPIGTPPPGSRFAPAIPSALINRTVPARDYHVRIDAILTDGSIRHLKDMIAYSSPEAPVLESISTTDREAVISYRPPEGDDVTFYIEYYPSGQEEYANFVETRASLVKLRGLLPATTFHIRILAVYKAMVSENAIEADFTTKEQEIDSVTAITDPPTPFPLYSLKSLFNTVSLPVPSPSPTDLTRLQAQQLLTSILTRTSMENTNSPTSEWTSEMINLGTTSSSTEQSKAITLAPWAPPSKIAIPYSSTSGTIEILSTSPPTTRLTTKKTTLRTTTMHNSDEVISESGEESTTPSTRRSSTTASSRRTTATTTEPDIVTEDYSERPEEEPLRPVEEYPNPGTPEEPMDPIDTVSEVIPGYGIPGEVRLSRQGKQLKVEWTQPEKLNCDAFVLNYTTISDGKPFSIGSAKPYALIKMFDEETIEMKVFCLTGGVLTKEWWAHRRVDLRKPKAVENLRISSVLTDEFYVATITLEHNINKWHDFEQYKLVVSYAPGKTLKQGHDLTVLKRGPILIDKLEPAQIYTFAVRNVSRELGLSSQAKVVRQVTAPIISSTLYPGQISSSAININFGDSDPEQGRFQYYELVFTGNTKNVTKKLKMDDEKSFTFTKLIPGKTYNFELYTVYENVRSRPVIANITTYPNKVNKFYPIIGPEYAVLYWDVENLAENDCRFRLSYSSTSNTGQQSTQTVELKNKTNYRFEGMQPETYYTFTIIVIMGTGAMEAESESESTTVGFSPRSRSTPVLERYSSRELAIEFENDHNTFADTNGVIDNFAIIVAEDPKLGGDGFVLKSWFDVRDDNHWPSYRASLSNYNPFKSRTVRSTRFIIGQDDCTRRRMDEPYCNGILRANINYQVKIRAYSVSNVGMETDWVSISGLVSEEPNENEHQLPCHMYLNGCPKRKSASRRHGESNWWIMFLWLFIAGYGAQSGICCC